MKTTIKQTIATAIIITIGTFLIRAAIDLVSRTIDNPTTHLVVSIGLVLWITMLLIWLLSRVLIALREPTSVGTDRRADRRTIYTDQELADRERANRNDNATLPDSDEIFTRQQESLKRKYAVK